MQQYFHFRKQKKEQISIECNVLEHKAKKEVGRLLERYFYTKTEAIIEHNLRQNYSKQSMTKHHSLHFPLPQKYPSYGSVGDNSACLINNQKKIKTY